MKSDVAPSGAAGRPDVMRDGPAYVLAVCGAKGGVGKTTTAVVVASELSRSLPVTLCDLDPQGDASTSLGFRVDTLGVERTVGAVLFDGLGGEGGARFDDVAVPVSEDGLFRLVPANRELARVSRVMEADQLGMYALAKALRSSGRPGEVVVLDCPPTTSTLVLAALHAADGILLTATPDVRAFHGVDRILDEVGRLAEVGLAAGVPLGVVLCRRAARTRLGGDAEEFLASYEDRGVPVLGVIPQTVRVSESAVAGVPVTQFVPTHPVADAYRVVAEKVSGLIAAEVGAGSRTSSKVGGVQ